MNVAFCIRADHATRAGGDTFQLERTREWLERAHGVRGTIVTDAAQLAAGRFDLAHVFNLQALARTVRFVEAARRSGLPVALSTIYWDFAYARAYESQLRLGRFGLTEAGLRWAIRIKRAEARFLNPGSYFGARYQARVRGVLEACGALLPNSDEELEILARFAGVPLDALRPRATVVYNAASPAAVADAGEAGHAPVDAALRGRYVLEVARIEPCKNQYMLIEALRADPEIPLVFVGNRQAHPAYRAAVERAARRRGHVFFFDHQPQEVLRRFYRDAALHALPSLRESPGLATLEALANGCPALVADRRFCPVDTYFGAAVTVVNPLDADSMRRGVREALAAPRDTASARERMARTFTWEVAARQTAAAYRLLLGVVPPA